MLLKHCIRLLITSFILTVYGNQDDLFEADISKSASENECWKSRGIPVTKCADCSELDYRRSGHVELYKHSNGTLIAFNRGYEFISKTDPETPKTFSREVQNALDDGYPAFLRFYKDSEEWVAGDIIKKRESGGSCLQIRDFKCSQTAVLSSEADYLRLEQLGCKELFGDLIIANFLFDPSKSYAALEKLEKLHGRLIIDRSFGDLDLEFSSLVSVSQEESSDPVLQITSNRMKSISFPKLEDFHSLKVASRSVVIGENVMLDDSLSVMPVYWKQQVLKNKFPAKMDIKVEGKKETKKTETTKKAMKQKPWMTEKYLKEKNISYKVIRLYRNTFSGNQIIYRSVAVVLFAAAIGLFCSRICCENENFEFSTDPEDEGSQLESEASESEATSSVTSRKSTVRV